VTFTGNLIAESLRVGCSLDDLDLTVHRITREEAGDASAGQPVGWTFIALEVASDEVGGFADAVRAALAPGPWYCDLQSDGESIVVFAGRVFRYPRGDPAGRAEAEAYARRIGVPEAQIDWRE
jgi:hypothetical protein